MEILLFPVQTHGRFIAANDRGLAQLGLDHRFMFRYTRGHRIQLFKQRTYARSVGRYPVKSKKNWVMRFKGSN